MDNDAGVSARLHLRRGADQHLICIFFLAAVRMRRRKCRRWQEGRRKGGRESVSPGRRWTSVGRPGQEPRPHSRSSGLHYIFYKPPRSTQGWVGWGTSALWASRQRGRRGGAIRGQEGSSAGPGISLLQSRGGRGGAARRRAARSSCCRLDPPSAGESWRSSRVMDTLRHPCSCSLFLFLFLPPPPPPPQHHHRQLFSFITIPPLQ